MRLGYCDFDEFVLFLSHTDVGSCCACIEVLELVYFVYNMRGGMMVC